MSAALVSRWSARACVVLTALAIAGCRQRADPPDAGAPDAAGPGASGAPDASAPEPKQPSAVASSLAPASSSSGPASSSSAPVPPAPASSSSAGAAVGEGCKLLRGPQRMSLRGPALLWTPDPAARGDFRIIFNRDGAAQQLTPPFGGLGIAGVGARPGGRLAQPADVLLDAGAGDGEGPARAAWPACAVADRFVFCMDTSGAIRRTPLSGGPDVPVGFGRRGSGIAAVALPGGHTLLAFLADRKTTEGVVTQAFAVLDDKPAVPLSEEGSGATFVTLAPWKGRAMAMYIDARVALTPVHARPVGMTGEGKLEIGRDAVIFVGGAGESRTGGALAVGADGPLFALAPVASGAADFGMAAIRIDDAPRDDMPAVWSPYPNGLSPAPIAATQGASPVHVARVRPKAREPGAPHVLEIGRLDGEGRFTARCEVAEGKSFKHVAIEADREGALWLAYTTGTATFLEQRAAGP